MLCILQKGSEKFYKGFGQDHRSIVLSQNSHINAMVTDNLYAPFFSQPLLCITLLDLVKLFLSVFHTVFSFTYSEPQVVNISIISTLQIRKMKPSKFPLRQVRNTAFTSSIRACALTLECATPTTGLLLQPEGAPPPLNALYIFSCAP